MVCRSFVRFAQFKVSIAVEVNQLNVDKRGRSIKTETGRGSGCDHLCPVDGCNLHASSKSRWPNET